MSTLTPEEIEALRSLCLRPMKGQEQTTGMTRLGEHFNSLCDMALASLTARQENPSEAEMAWHRGYKEGERAGLNVAARMVDHILREGGGTYGDAIRALLPPAQHKATCATQLDGNMAGACDCLPAQPQEKS